MSDKWKQHLTQDEHQALMDSFVQMRVDLEQARNEHAAALNAATARHIGVVEFLKAQVEERIGHD
jgi:hypothetical protein